MVHAQKEKFRERAGRRNDFDVLQTGQSRQKTKPLKPAALEDSTVILARVFDACLDNDTTSFTSEALFNRLIIELWHRRALNCLNLDRDEFVKQLEQRGWSYNTRNHTWSKAGYPKKAFTEMMLFER